MANDNARAYLLEVLRLPSAGAAQRTARCPFHDDRKKSLSINLETGAWTCHATCGSGGLAQFRAKLPGTNGTKPHAELLSFTQMNREARARQDKGKPEAVYDYTDSNGKVAFHKYRYSGKDFVLRRPDGSDRLDGVSARPLYNLPRVLKAQHIVWCEGEKDADNVQAALDKVKRKDWAATTTFSSSAKWRTEYDAAVKGKDVVIVPDNDDAGRKYANLVTAGAERLAKTVKLLVLPGLADKGDVSDYLAENTAKQFAVALTEARAAEDPTDDLFITAAEFAKQTVPDVPWVVEGLLAFGSSTQLIGKNKCGKSTFTHALVRSILDRTNFLRKRSAYTSVVYLTEMPETDLRFQLKEARLLDHPDLHLLPWHRTLALTWPEAVEAARRRCRRVGARLLIIDTFSVWTRIKDENSSSEVLQAMLPIEQVIADGIAVWIESHERKAGGEIADAGRGSGALTGKVSIIAKLGKPQGKHPETQRQLDVTGRFHNMTAVIELRGANYEFLGTQSAVALNDAEERIREVLRATKNIPLSQTELCERTKTEGYKNAVSRTTAQRALEKLLNMGIVVRVGNKAGGYRYCIKDSDMLATPTKHG